MKKHLFSLLLVALLCSCSGGPTQDPILDPIPDPYDTIVPANPNHQNNPVLKSYNDTVNEFCLDFAEQYINDFNDGTNNILSSPISMYFALAMAAYVTGNDTQSQILDALHTTYEDLGANISSLYDSFQEELRTNKVINKERQVLFREILDNSLWLDKNFEYKIDCLNEIADKFYAPSYQLDFKFDNSKANEILEDYCFEKTNKMIRPDFDFDKETFFVILNNFYLKVLWSANSKFYYSFDPYTFTNNNQTTVSKCFLESFYFEGQPFENDEVSAFYVKDEQSKIKLTFILPKDNNSISEVMNKKNISEILNHTYIGKDEEHKIVYLTKVLFPQFSVKNNQECIDTLKNMGIVNFFDKESADFSKITDEKAVCKTVKQCSSLDVNERGLEGSVVTAIGGYVTGVDPYTYITTEFLVDKAFGFIVETTNTDNNNLVFSGIINTIE